MTCATRPLVSVAAWRHQPDWLAQPSWSTGGRSPAVLQAAEDGDPARAADKLRAHIISFVQRNFPAPQTTWIR